MPREREGRRARSPELPRDEVKCVEHSVEKHPLRALIDAHRPERCRRFRARKEKRDFADLTCGHAQLCGDGFRLVGFEKGLERGQINRLLPVAEAHVPFDEARIDVPFCADDLRHGVEQKHIRAGSRRQVNVRALSGQRAARINHDEFDVLVCAPALLRALKQRRMAFEGIRADDEDAIGMIDVFVASRRFVLAINLCVARRCRSHAQARIAVDVVGAKACLEEFVRRIGLFGDELAGAIERNRIRP